MKDYRRLGMVLSLLLAGIVISANQVVSANDTFQSKSSKFGVNEVFIGSGGSLDSSSSDYQARMSLGETAVGSASDSGYSVHAGFTTTDVPILEFAVNGGTYSLGVLNTTTTATNSATFSVLNYQSSGYVVIISGTPPQNGSYTLSAMTSPALSATNTEQFGVNLAANTSPPVGQVPQQVPSNTFGFGSATANYNTANHFMFHSGDTIASSTKASGETLYTLSMIANISSSTRGGAYTGTLGLVVAATF